jgi:hypothetical protein
MPAESQAQQSAMAVALAAKRGKLDPDKLKGAAKHLYKTMSASELEEYASTKRKGLPPHKGARRPSRMRKSRST